MINEESEPLNLKKLQSGDTEELTKMVQQYSDPIYRVALRMLNDQAEAEDVLQETFIKALRSLENFEGRSNLSTWLYRIAVNESLMVIRKRKPEISIKQDDAGDEENEGISVSQIVDWCCLPESEFLTNETRGVLADAIQKLPENLRTVFILRDIEGLSIIETAQALELTETNVKTRLLRARMKLREELSVYFGERLTEY
ncbi:MAG: RNA polymerase subunit sigma-24 [Chloroflexi bacterium HGW-Chloroflexi-2]|jgi:RNA polymerase sigma-70 factor (ECF subfamily)|nr:MAG: RNA polymerase subunit sigma-24 [Chloroflexi bacterium HGW-Chloroflexi-2]